VPNSEGKRQQIGRRRWIKQRPHCSNTRSIYFTVIDTGATGNGEKTAEKAKDETGTHTFIDVDRTRFAFADGDGNGRYLEQKSKQTQHR
jgi:hypothetical protein